MFVDEEVTDFNTDIRFVNCIDSLTFTQLRKNMEKYSFVFSKNKILKVDDLYASCILFLKKKMCSHVFHILNEKKLTNLLDIPLEQKARRGRRRQRETHMNASFYRSRR